jgi:hypothetical protein
MKPWPTDKSAKEILDDLYVTMNLLLESTKRPETPDLHYYPEWMYTQLMPPPTLENIKDEKHNG